MTVFDHKNKTGILCKFINVMLYIVWCCLKNMDISRTIRRYNWVESDEAKVVSDVIRPEHVLRDMTLEYSRINAPISENARGVSSALVGIEILDILDENDYPPRKLEIRDGVETWSLIGRHLFGWDIGKLAKIETTSAVSAWCKIPPQNCNLLIVPLPILKSYFDYSEQFCYKQTGRSGCEWNVTRKSSFRCPRVRCSGRCSATSYAGEQHAQEERGGK
jgi:hypothetical protein